MRPVLSVAFVLACAFALDAQITTTLNHLPDGSDEVRARNDSPMSLMAFAVAGKRSLPVAASPGDLLRPDRTPEASGASEPFVIYSDPLIEPEKKPLPSSEERVMMTMHWQTKVAGKLQSWRLKEPIVAAGILADGSATGDPALLTRLMLRRSSMLLAVETALETLSYAGRQSLSRYELIVQFKKMAACLHRWYLPQEQQIGLRIYQPILGELMNMQRGQDGSPDPLATYIGEETASLRQQRIRLSESQPSLLDVALLGR